VPSHELESVRNGISFLLTSAFDSMRDLVVGLHVSVCVCVCVCGCAGNYSLSLSLCVSVWVAVLETTLASLMGVCLDFSDRRTSKEMSRVWGAVRVARSQRLENHVVPSSSSSSIFLSLKP
jgi:hypothetical protein